MTVLLQACVIFWNLLLQSLSAEGDAFKFASELHQDICEPSRSPNNDSRCCGFCSDGQDCELHGSCLNMHETFAEGKLSIETTR